MTTADEDLGYGEIDSLRVEAVGVPTRFHLMTTISCASWSYLLEGDDVKLTVGVRWLFEGQTATRLHLCVVREETLRKQGFESMQRWLRQDRPECQPRLILAINFEFRRLMLDRQWIRFPAYYGQAHPKEFPKRSRRWSGLESVALMRADSEAEEDRLMAEVLVDVNNGSA